MSAAQVDALEPHDGSDCWTSQPACQEQLTQSLSPHILSARYIIWLMIYFPKTTAGLSMVVPAKAANYLLPPPFPAPSSVSRKRPHTLMPTQTFRPLCTHVSMVYGTMSAPAERALSWPQTIQIHVSLKPENPKPVPTESLGSGVNMKASGFILPTNVSSSSRPSAWYLKHMMYMQLAGSPS